ncbi:hypothetical protein CVS40_11241 [Lucilia cuprina]|nr:hypothetical protein CVS40_11241 [Lucilia cuprina]
MGSIFHMLMVFEVIQTFLLLLLSAMLYEVLSITVCDVCQMLPYMYLTGRVLSFKPSISPASLNERHFGGSLTSAIS